MMDKVVRLYAITENILKAIGYSEDGRRHLSDSVACKRDCRPR